MGRLRGWSLGILFWLELGWWAKQCQGLLLLQARRWEALSALSLALCLLTWIDPFPWDVVLWPIPFRLEAEPLSALCRAVPVEGSHDLVMVQPKGSLKRLPSAGR